MSMVDAGVRSLVAAPLLGPEGSLGMIALSSSAASRTFTEEDMELLVSLASVAALRLRNISLAAQAAERERLAAEVALARRIQLAILPDRLPEIETLEMYGQSIPSRVTSGDFYKAFSRADGHQCVLFLADVSGKGLPAALVTGALEALSAGPLETGLGPAETFNRISQRLFERTPPEKYATAFLAVVDTASGEISYANAGHNAALVLREPGGEEWLGATGTPLGLLPGMEYGGNTVMLAPGDTLILYTDGITEASDAEDNEFGRDRMAGVFAKHRRKSLKDWAEALEKELLAFTGGTPFADDRTLLMVRRRK
ncbi:MAG: SpoIIE family protein phosphatase [Acidobacteriota bacterium]